MPLTITVSITPYALVTLLFASIVLNVFFFCRIQTPTSIRQSKPKHRAVHREADAKVALASTCTLAPNARSRPQISSLVDAVKRLRELKEARRFLEAGDLLDALHVELSKRSDSQQHSWWDAAWDTTPSEATAQLQQLLADGTELEQRIAQFRETHLDLNTEMADGDGWEVIREEAALSVLLRRQSTLHSRTSAKVEATLEGVRAADCMLMWREAALYPCWFPFVSGGNMLGERDAGEAFLQLFVETSFINVDIPLWGIACDDMQRSGCMLLSCRPRPDWPSPLPAGVVPPTTPDQAPFKLLGSWTSTTYIDILIEPLGPAKVRFVFQMGDVIPSATPSWMLRQIVENAMGNIFREMASVAVRMAADDPACAHTRHVNSPPMAATKRWYEAAMRGEGGPASFVM